MTGYEIHQGITRSLQSNLNAVNWVTHPLFEDETLGVVNDNQSVWGCYLHGVFDNGAWRRTWLNYLRSRRGLDALPTGITNYREQREASLDKIADLVETFVDLTPML